MSRTHFKLNLHSTAAGMSRNSLLETDAISEIKWLQRDSNPNHLVCKGTLNHLPYSNLYNIKPIQCFYLYKLMLSCIAFFSCIFTCFYPWCYLLNVRASSTNFLLFSVLLSIYSVIYSKKYALYLGKFSVTCLKCSRASFSPSFYSKKMRRGRGCHSRLPPPNKFFLPSTRGWFLPLNKNFHVITQ